MKVNLPLIARRHFTACSLFLVFVGITYYLCYHQVYTPHRFRIYFSDVPDHLIFAMLIMQHKITIGWMGLHWLAIATHYLLHVELPTAFILCTAALAGLSYLIVYRMLRYFLSGQYDDAPLALIAGALLIVASVYAPWYSAMIYKGQWSPNPWHSPTYTAMKPFALLAFFLCLGVVDNKTSRPNTDLAWLSLCLAISTFIKPSFTSCFIPALAIYLLAVHPGQYRLYARFFLALLPVVLLIIWQTYIIYVYNTDSAEYKLEAVVPDRIILDPLGVWKKYSPSPLFSFLMATAFPLSVLLLRFKHMFNSGCMMAWITFFVATLMWCLLAEQRRYIQGNFSWGYDMGLQLIFLFSAIEWLRWFKEWQRGLIARQIAQGGLVLSGTIFLWHLASGTIYLCDMLQGRTPMH